MKKIIITSIFAGMFLTHLLSQQNQEFKPAWSLQKLPLYGFKSNITHLDTSKLAFSLNQPLQNNYFKNNPFSNKSNDILLNPLPSKKNQFSSNMPCLKPKGNFPMPIYGSDTTVRYSLLIKE